MEAQGLFINLCAVYWSNGCTMSYAKAKRRYSGCNATVWKELINEEIIKVSGDTISINFLDEQLLERKDLSDQNAQNASKRWKKDTTALPSNSGRKVPASNIEEKREEEKRKEEKRGEEISLSDFENLFDDIWKEQVQMVHKGKNLKEIIPKAYLHLSAGGRLLNGTTAEFKQCVQAFLNNEKPENGRKKPSFNLKDI